MSRSNAKGKRVRRRREVPAMTSAEAIGSAVEQKPGEAAITLFLGPATVRIEIITR